MGELNATSCLSNEIYRVNRENTIYSVRNMPSVMINQKSFILHHISGCRGCTYSTHNNAVSTVLGVLSGPISRHVSWAENTCNVCGLSAGAISASTDSTILVVGNTYFGHNIAGDDGGDQSSRYLPFAKAVFQLSLGENKPYIFVVLMASTMEPTSNEIGARASVSRAMFVLQC